MSEKNTTPNLNNIPKDKFEFVQIDSRLHDEVIQGEAIGFFKDAMIRFRKNKAALVSFIIIAILAFMAIFGPSMSKYGFADQNVKLQNLPREYHG